MRQVEKRKHDLVTRFGGEEFAVILPNTKLDGVRVLADSILEAIRSLAVPTPISGQNLSLTVSIGGNVIVPEREKSIKNLVQTADSALYLAKELGKNRSIIYGDILMGQSTELTLLHRN